ncbi:MAG: hypothetical protein J6W52_01025 [Bacteroidaceae bacterium]|nr:hypothetical protein [Bacteroidaceae bacterium]
MNRLKKYALATLVLFVQGIEINAQCMVNTFDNVRQIKKISASDFRKQEGQDFPIDTIQYTGPEAINFVLLGDGYTETEQTKFVTAAKNVYNALFRKIPMNRYKKWFNLYAIEVISNESGISHPGVLKDGKYVCPEGSSLPIKNVDTYFGIHFDAYNIHRLPCPDNSTKIYNLLKALMPDYQMVGILCNTSEYGGAGGSFLTCTTHSSASEIFIHEFGHTFASLADEYYAGDGYLGEYINQTANNNSNTIKWKHWYGQSGVSAFPIGGSTKGNGYYKPVNGTCEMEYLNKEFCPVCREAIVEEMHNRVKVIAEYQPTARSLTMDGDDLTFTITRYYKGTSNKINFEWSINNVVQEDETSNQLILKSDVFETVTPQTVKVKANEVCPYVKDTKHATKHVSTVTWRVQLGTVGVEAFTHDDFSVEAVNGGLRLKSEKPHAVTVYSLHGQKVAHVNVCGEEMIQLPAGIYIVDGKKMLVDR